MAALPLQGLAAVSMLLCSGTASKVMQMPDAGHGQGLDSAGATSHDHHAMSADHGMQDHAAHAQSASEPHDHGAASHECGICGAGCHSVAIAPSADALHLSSVPQGPAATPIPQVHTRTTPVPDRPPRA